MFIKICDSTIKKKKEHEIAQKTAFGFFPCPLPAVRKSINSVTIPHSASEALSLSGEIGMASVTCHLISSLVLLSQATPRRNS